MNEDSYLDSYFEDQNELAYDGGGFPGDGSGTDDFADYNANEADDYRNEGADDYDHYADEDRFESDDGGE